MCEKLKMLLDAATCISLNFGYCNALRNILTGFAIRRKWFIIQFLGKLSTL